MESYGPKYLRVTPKHERGGHKERGNFMFPARMIRLSVCCTLIMALGGASAAAAAIPGGEQPLDLCGIVSCRSGVPGAVATGTPATFHGDILHLTPGCTAAPSFDWDFGDGSAHANQAGPHPRLCGTRGIHLDLHRDPSRSLHALYQLGHGAGVLLQLRSRPIGHLRSPAPARGLRRHRLPGSCSDPIAFSWDFGDGSALSHEQDPSHIYTGEGVFTWTMTATSGELTCFRTGQIRVPCSALACAATAPDITVPGQLVTFSGAVTPPQCPDPIVYDWDFGDGSPHAQTLAPSHAYAGTGTTRRRPAVSGAALCEKSGSVKVVNPPAITLIKKVAPPFELVVTGDNLQNGIKVYIDETEWTSVAWKSTGKIQLKGGAALKAAVPKGVTTIFRFLNPDGGETTTTWRW